MYKQCTLTLKIKEYNQKYANSVWMGFKRPRVRISPLRPKKSLISLEKSRTFVFALFVLFDIVDDKAFSLHVDFIFRISSRCAEWYLSSLWSNKSDLCWGRANKLSNFEFLRKKFKKGIDKKRKAQYTNWAVSAKHSSRERAADGWSLKTIQNQEERGHDFHESCSEETVNSGMSFELER